MDKNVFLRPTVIIGLGGSGYEIVLNLKARFVETFGAVPKIISLLVFDTTQNPNVVRTTSDGKQVALTKGEFYPVTVSSPHTVLEINDNIQSWFPPNIPRDAVVNGAGQIRARGRLALFVNFDAFDNAISQAKDNVRAVKRQQQVLDEGYDISAKGGEEIFICGSLSGGTGSGTFLDTAWIARENLSTDSHVTGIFVLPRIFRKNVNPSYLVYKNTYAALKELDAFMEGKLPGAIDYGRKTITPKLKPYDLVYLIDGINRENKVIEEADQLYAFAAEAMFLLIGSQMGKQSDNTMDNILPQLTVRPAINGKRAVYMSLGVGRVNYPIRHAVEEATYGESLRLIGEELLTGQLKESDLENEVKTFLEQQRLREEEADDVIDALIRTPDGGRFNINISVSHVELSRNAHDLAAQSATNRQQVLHSELQRLVERNYQELESSRVSALEKAVLAHLQRSAAARTTGIPATVALLRKFEARFEFNRNLMVREIEECQSKLARISVAESLAVVKHAAQRFLISKTALQSALAEYGSAVTTQSRYQMEIERRQRAAQLFGNLVAKVKALAERVETVRRAVELVVASIEEKKTTLAYRRPIESAFERKIDARRLNSQGVHTSAEEFLAITAMAVADWTLQTKDEIESKLLEYVRERVMKTTKASVEAVLSTEDLVRELSMLKTMSSPLWKFDQANIPVNAPGTIQFYVYGVESQENTRLNDADVSDQLPRGAAKPAFVTTRDPQNIYQLQIEAGLPLFALEDVKTWKGEYEDPSLLSSGHIFRDGENYSDLLFTEERAEALRTFALALCPAFDVVMKETAVGAEAKYYVTRKEGLSTRKLDLGAGRVIAYRTFVANQQLVRDVADLIRQREQTTKRDEIMTQVVEHYHTLEGLIERNPSLPQDLQQQIRRELNVLNKYVDDLKSVADQV